VAGFEVPAPLALVAALRGVAFAAWPLAGIVAGAVLLHELVVATGELAVIEAALAAVTPDRRLQALLVGFGLGPLLEGAAGFGTPVVIAGATLAALGFPPALAAAVVLVANTSAYGFGGVGIGIAVAARVSGHDPAALAALVGRNVALLSLAVPFLLVTLVAGARWGLGAWPAALAAGAAFAAAQALVARLLGPQLADVAGAVAGLAALLALLRAWRPRVPFRFPSDPPPAERTAPPPARALRAFAPFAMLAVLVAAWSLPPVRALLDAATVVVPVPLPQGAASGGSPQRDALVRLDLLAANGTAVLAAVAASAVGLGATARDLRAVLRRAGASLRRPVLTMALVLAFAFLMDASGMAATLGRALAGAAGGAFPLASVWLGWLGVGLTGSITSSNALFAALQAAAAAQAGMAPLLAVAANVIGGTCAQMLAPQLMAVAAAGVPGVIGREAEVLRPILGRSIALAAAMSVVVAVQAGPLSWSLPVSGARARVAAPTEGGAALLAGAGALVALLAWLARRAGRAPRGPTGAAGPVPADSSGSP
jgi:lactate permease